MNNNKVLNTWEVVHDADLDDGTPTMWSIKVKTEERKEIYYWICLVHDGTYNVELNDGETVLKNCKSLTSAKRWVTMNLL